MELCESGQGPGEQRIDGCVGYIFAHTQLKRAKKNRSGRSELFLGGGTNG